MKKLLSAILASVMLAGNLMLPASAATVRYYDEKKLYPMSEAPAMDYTRTIGPVTFSNVGAVNEFWTEDANGETIKVYDVSMGVNGCMRSDADGTEFFMIDDGTYNSVYPEIDRLPNMEWPFDREPIFTDDYNAIKTNTPAIRLLGAGIVTLKRSVHHYITAYAGERNEDGTWPAGLTWQFKWHEEDALSSAEYMYYKIYTMQASLGDEMWYYLLRVEDDISSFTGNRLDGSYTPINQVNAPAVAEAVPSIYTLYVSSQPVALDIYDIDGAVYMKLRDIAAIYQHGERGKFQINGSGDGLTGPLSLETGESYTPVGGELANRGTTKQTASLISPVIYVDGVETPMTAYNVGGEAYFKLNDVLKVTNMGYHWSEVYHDIRISTSYLAPTYHNSRQDESAIPATCTAKPGTPVVYVGGSRTAMEGYEINGECYFRLRDVAQCMNGTEKQFDVIWNGDMSMGMGDTFYDGVTTLWTGMPYTTVGGELQKLDGQEKTAVSSRLPVQRGDEFAHFLNVYEVGGETFYNLKDIARCMNFNVRWDTARGGIGIDGVSSFDPVDANTVDKNRPAASVPAAPAPVQPKPVKPEPTVDTGFTDVKAGDWYQTYVQKITDAQWMSGKGNNLFDPNGNLALSEVLVLAAKFHAQRTDGVIPSAEGVWYMPYYTYCRDHGLLPEDSFSLDEINRAATRLEMVEVLDRASGADSTQKEVNRIENGFIPDIREEDKTGDVVYRWYRAGILTGDVIHAFQGTKSITRAEVAVILCRLLDLEAPAVI